MAHQDKRAEFLSRIAETAEHGGWKRLADDLGVSERALRRWQADELKGSGNGDTSPPEVEQLRQEVERLREFAHAAGQMLTSSQHLNLMMELDLMGREVPESELSPEEKARRQRVHEESIQETRQQMAKDGELLCDHFTRLGEAYLQLGLAFKTWDEPARVRAFKLVRSIEAEYPDPGVRMTTIR